MKILGGKTFLSILEKTSAPGPPPGKRLGPHRLNSSGNRPKGQFSPSSQSEFWSEGKPSVLRLFFCDVCLSQSQVFLCSIRGDSFNDL
jgi:hypothetical protein